MLLIKSLSIIICLIIFMEDMRSRSVHWFWFPLLAILLITSNHFAHKTTTELLTSALLNIAFILMQLFLVTVYFSIKQGKLTNITNGLLGWGDILFIITMALYFPFINFIVFYVISLVIVLIGWLAYVSLIKKANQHIPLAGLQSLLVASLLVIGCFNSSIRLTNDDLLINLINS